MCNSLTVVDGWNPVHGWNVDAESWMDLWKSSRFQQNQFFPPLDWLDPWVQPSCSGAGADFIQAMPGTTPTRKSIKMDNVNVSERGYVQEHWEKRDDGIVPQQWLTPCGYWNTTWACLGRWSWVHRLPGAKRERFGWRHHGQGYDLDDAMEQRDVSKVILRMARNILGMVHCLNGF